MQICILNMPVVKQQYLKKLTFGIYLIVCPFSLQPSFKVIFPTFKTLLWLNFSPDKPKPLTSLTTLIIEKKFWF